MKGDLVTVSKFLSLVLRHKPEEIGLELDDAGWADVEDLIRLANARGRRLTRELVLRVAAENDKQRFALSDDGGRIRASQGHSVAVDLELPPSAPPELLYHGTATRFLDSIRAEGLRPGGRRHVHLSLDEATATNVGRRHGKPAILVVQAGQMRAAGYSFYVSANGVWLTERVPVEYLQFPSQDVACSPP